MASEKLRLPILFPVHPRTAGKINSFNVKFNSAIKITGPMDFLSFLYCEAKAALILTDSGGVQEESCILKVPCVTLRENTERPETLRAGSNVIAGVAAQDIARASVRMAPAKRNWKNPFGDGNASQRILKILLESLV
jgi:UDP-N-acetylglucosamine 2-epimerase (non-hydrolysing)